MSREGEGVSPILSSNQPYGGSVRDRQGSKLSPSHEASSGLSSSTAIGALHRPPARGWAGSYSMGHPHGCAELTGEQHSCVHTAASKCCCVLGASAMPAWFWPMQVKTLPDDLQAPVGTWGVPGCG